MTNIGINEAPDDETDIVLDSLIRFIDREVAQCEKENVELLSSERTIYGPDGRYSDTILALRKNIRMRSAELGFYNLFGSEKLGGSGWGAKAALRTQERLNMHCGPDRALVQTVVLPSPFTNGLSPLLEYLNSELLENHIKHISSGERTLCFALSEPDAGSDVFGIKTVARRDGEFWVLNGTKQWITNAPYADYAFVFAITNGADVRARKGGITGFFIETNTVGFNVPRTIPIMGHLGSEIGVITLDNLRVHDSHRIGPVDKGLNVAMHGINAGRLAMAGTCVGLARWALNQSLDYARIRKAFGKYIAEHQAIQTMLAEIAMDIYASKSMASNCADLLERGVPVTKEISMVKAYSTEMLNRVMDKAIQIHGGMGLTNELRLEAGYRFARILKIPDGTAEIQRRTIAKELLSGNIEI